MEQQINTAQKVINTIIEFLVNYSFQALGAIIVLIIGLFLGGWVGNMVIKLSQKKNVDITLSKFFANIAKLSVVTFAVIIALSKFGITIAPFIAAISAAAFGASFAIQGPLSNYGAGLSIILSRPFVVGNTITVAGVHGIVEEVKFAATVLIDEDGIRITIPNKHIVGEIVANSRENKIIEGTIGVSYEQDPTKAIQIVRDLIVKQADVVENPRPQVGIQSFGESAISIEYRYWVPTQKRFQVLTQVNENIWKAFRDNKIEIPYPHRDVHLISENIKA